MAEQAKQQQKALPADPPKEKPKGEMVTYVPGRHDSPEAKWRGVTFIANKPVLIEDPEHIEAARGNRHFKVGDEEIAPHPADDPKTPEQYKAHVIEWAKSARSVEDIVTLWADERKLRDECEIGEPDIRWMGTIIEPRLHQLAMEEGLDERKVANVWIKHGILDIPWRS